MSSSGAMRASDAEREQAADALREHYAAGRITSEELVERLDRVYAARTMSELDQLAEDLPPLTRTPALRAAELATRRAELRGRLLQQAGGSFTPFVICTLIWAASGAGYFWPVWVLIFPLVFIVRNLWRLYGPAPELDRVHAELERRGRHRHRHEGDPRLRELP
jgi:hypothetical protein